MSQTISVDTLIIGAGVAGLNAACKLNEKDQKDFLVLEADDYIGGRVRTTTTEKGNIINTGAHWVHPIDGTVDNNPVSHDLAWFDLPAITDGNAHLDIIFADGVERKVSFRDRMLSEVSRAAEIFYPGVNHENIAFEDLVKKLNNPRYSALAYYIRNNWMAATSSDHCSLADIESDPHSSGGLVVEGGMSTYVEELADEAGRDKIHTNTKIVSLEEMPHEVIAKDVQGNRYLAKHVILTPSVGVLKSGAIKVEGEAGNILNKHIDGYQMGEMFKMTFELPKEMFARNKHRTNRRFIVLPSDQRPALCITGNPDNPTLTILCGGVVGHELERSSGQEQLAFAHKVVGMAQGLKDMLPYLNGQPHVTQWSTNPLVQGAYATKRLGFKGHDAPCWIGNRIVVAGEAFHSQVGYLDSALVSGERAAADVVERLSAISCARS